MEHQSKEKHLKTAVKIATLQIYKFNILSKETGQILKIGNLK